MGRALAFLKLGHQASPFMSSVFPVRYSHSRLVSYDDLRHMTLRIMVAP